MTTPITKGLICFLLVISCMIASAEELDWFKWRGPNGNSITTEREWDPKALEPEPRILWHANVGFGYSSVCVRGKYAYSMGYNDEKDTVYCLSLETGEKIWAYSYPCVEGSFAGTRATPVYADGRLYTVSRLGDVHCFEADTGKLKWYKDVQKDANAKPPTWHIASSVIIEGKMALLNVGKYGLALNKDTGAIIWQSPRGISGYASPVLYDFEHKRCLAAFGQKAVYGVEAESGKLLWTKEWITKLDEHSSDPVVWNGHVFVSSIYSTGCAVFDTKHESLRNLWIGRQLVTKFMSSVLYEGKLYGVHGNTGRRGGKAEGTLRCVDFMTGKIHWDHYTGMASLIIADGKLIILNEKGMLFIAETGTGGYRELSKGQVLLGGDEMREAKGKCWTAPILCRGRIFCRDDRGEIVCVDVASKN